jgi:hypothetical protein
MICCLATIGDFQDWGEGHRQQGNSVNLVLFFQNGESRLKVVLRAILISEKS